MHDIAMKRKEILDMVHENKLSIYDAEEMLKELITNLVQEHKKEESFTMYLQQEWVQKDFEPFQSSTGNCYLVFDTDRHIYDFLREKVGQTYAKVVLVERGEKFQKLSENVYTINPKSFNEYELLFQHLKDDNINTNRILDMWSAKEPENNFSILLCLCQVLIKTSKNTIQIINPFKMSGTISDSYNNALNAVAKTVQLECSRIHIKTVAYDSDSNLLDLLWNELNSKEETEVIKYHNMVRYVNVLKETKNNRNAKEKSLLKEKGIYIITGGMGRIGMTIASYLAKHYHASLVLVGRTKRNEECEKKISELIDLGAAVLYVEADITILEDVKRLVSEAKNRFQRMDGIIHCAGAIRDSFFINKSIEDAKQVIAPKVMGTINLDEVTKNEKLDFMIYFSSISAIVGNVAQIDYAYANSFMDYFSGYRNKQVENKERFGKTISINWPFWKNGGMKLNESVFEEYQATIGMDAIPNDSAIDIFEYALKQAVEEYQIIIMYGTEKLRKLLNTKKSVNENKEFIKQPVVNDEILISKTERFFSEIFSELLKIPVGELGMDSRFQEYGVDSFVVREFNTVIEERFTKLSKTILFEYQTIGDLSHYVVKEYRDQLLKLFFGEDEERNPIGSSILLQPIQFETERQVNNKNQDNTIDADIAIIGVSIRFPKADNLDEFWNVLANGESGITKVPEDRWNNEAYYDEDNVKIKEGKYYCQWGGFIKDIDTFDPLFFGISPKEAELMDPQERLLLEEVWHVMEDAGYTKEELGSHYTDQSNQNVGVYIACTTNTYNLIAIDEWNKGNFVIPNSLPWSLANRISYLFNFNGPSMPMDTACSSGLTALHIACQSIKSGECSTAIVGGVNLYTHPLKYVLLSQLRMLSPSGKCHAFGADADGFVPGEGIGTLLLKPLKEAKKDKDYIYGIVKGSAINHGGQTNGYTVPNPEEHSNLICNALNNANVSPEEISYIEAHGTGTFLGDPIEITGLTKAYKKYTNKKEFCSIGSVKSNIGHLEGAAGLSGIAKILVQMKYKQLVPSLYTKQLNENIDFTETPFYVQQKLEDWKPTIIEKENNSVELPLKAAISSFGAGGANAHVIIEEYKEDREKVKVNNGLNNLFLLSAVTEEELKQVAKKLALFIEKNMAESDSDTFMEELAYALQCGRSAMDIRVAVYVNTLLELKEVLERVSSVEDPSMISSNTVITSFESYDVSEERVSELIQVTYLNKEQLIELAKFWVMKGKFNWKKFYHGCFPQKRPIPTYPFAKDHYWVPTDYKIGTVDKLHPMIDKNESDFNNQCYSKEFTASDLYIRDHKVNGEMILPGVAYLEMARASAQMAAKGEIITILKNVIWIRPLQLVELDAHCAIVLEPSEQNINFEVKTLQQNDMILHCQGQIMYEEAYEPNEEQFDVEAIKSRNSNIRSGQEWYKDFQNFGFTYGPYMQSIVKIYSGSKEVFAEIQLPDKYKEDFGAYVLYPSIMDGAFQSVMAFDKEVKGNGTIYLPYKIDKIEIFNKLPEKCFAYVVQTSVSEVQPEQLMLDIYLLDEKGDVLVKVSGYTAKQIRNQKIQKDLPLDEELLHLFEQIQNGELSEDEINNLLDGRKL